MEGGEGRKHRASAAGVLGFIVGEWDTLAGFSLGD